MNLPRETRWNFKASFLFGVPVLLLAALPLLARTAVDFDPNLDFTKYKTFAFLGGVENLVMLDVNPDLLNNRAHRAVTQATKLAPAILLAWSAPYTGRSPCRVRL